MNWQHFWDQQAKSTDNPHLQVSRTSSKLAVDEVLLERIADHIATRLGLQPTDRLLDVCCGNGMLTALLAKRCKEVVAVDLSEELIRLAKEQHPAENIHYVQGDATRLREVVSGPFDKINLYFSFQYMDTRAKGKRAMTEMQALLAEGGGIFLGDVPDYAHISVYYPGILQRIKYHLNLLLGRSLMGKFWREVEIERIVRVPSTGFSYSRMEQPSNLPYAHYRVDYLIGRVRIR